MKKGLTIFAIFAAIGAAAVAFFAIKKKRDDEFCDSEFDDDDLFCDEDCDCCDCTGTDCPEESEECDCSEAEGIDDTTDEAADKAEADDENSAE